MNSRYPNLRLIAVAVMALTAVTLSAQGLRDYKPNPATRLVIDNTAAPKTGSKTQTGTKQKDAQSQPAESDYALYRDVVHKYSWLEGLGEPISEETAKTLPVYYRLSLKNDAGHWQHIMAMHGDSLIAVPRTQIFSLVTVGGTDEQWTDRLASIAQWFITTSLDGSEVVEERAYDTDGNMIYSFQPLKNQACHIMGTYYDSWGYPIDFNEDSRYYYGTVLEIEYDDHGYNGVINFLDGYGLRKPNSDGVHQVRYTRDGDGKLREETFHNIVGDRCSTSDGLWSITYYYDENGVFSGKEFKY